MAYIGRPLNAGNLAVQSGTGDGSDTTPIATLDYSVGSSNSIAVYLDGVRQLAGTDFTATGTTLTFTTAPASGVGIDVYFLGLELSIPTPADNTVSTAKLVDDAVTLAKMAPGTDGNLISYDASGNPVAIATGNDGQVLTSAGAGAPPAFETLSAGKVLQVVSVTKSDTASNSSTTFADISGLSVSITPSATSSKLLIFGHINDGINTSSSMSYRIMRDSTAVGVGDAAGSRKQASAKSYHPGNASHSKTTPFSFLDSPNSSSALTIKIQMCTQSGATGYINRTSADGDANDVYSARGQSTLTVMEIGA